MLQQTDHERFEADWPSVAWDALGQAAPPRRRKPLRRR
jgi:hypothetical protein